MNPTIEVVSAHINICGRRFIDAFSPSATVGSPPENRILAHATKAVLKNGWYITGDIASINRDGSIQLQGRLSRFSKIAGEMVPHGAVEEALYQETGTDSSQLAVMGVPDEARGEKLVVLFTELPKEINEVIDTLRNNGLPNLWIPKPQNFIKIEEIPLLGSGKIDLKALKDLAIKMVGEID